MSRTITSNAHFKGYINCLHAEAACTAEQHKKRRHSHLPNKLPQPPIWKLCLAAKALAPEPNIVH